LGLGGSKGFDNNLTSRLLALTGSGADTDGDGCPDARELTGAHRTGGLRDPFNPYDYMNPTHDQKNRVDDILAVVNHYFKDDNDGTPGKPPYVSGYDPATDRKPFGPATWNLREPDGQVRVNDILSQVKQYFDDCVD
jgi:hypothetical protein